MSFGVISGERSDTFVSRNPGANISRSMSFAVGEISGCSYVEISEEHEARVHMERRETTDTSCLIRDLGDLPIIIPENFEKELMLDNHEVNFLNIGFPSIVKGIPCTNDAHGDPKRKRERDTGCDGHSGAKICSACSSIGHRPQATL